MSRPNALGEYLRARRELTDPADVGLPGVGVRRTPGLRREEVSALAGISADYYLRLEQGRDRNPSPQVLQALARVFRLDATATEHLLSLTAAARPARTRRPRRETVPAGIRQLLEAVNLPAFVESRSFDVLAANPLATAVSPGIRVGANRLREILLDPREQELFPDWEKLVRGMVAAFRTSIGADVEDPRIAQLVGELSLASDTFRRLWARHDVTALTGGSMRLQHPEVGLLELRREKLPIADSGGQILAFYHAAPGSESARRLAALAASVAGIPQTGAPAFTAPSADRSTRTSADASTGTSTDAG